MALEEPPPPWPPEEDWLEPGALFQLILLPCPEPLEFPPEPESPESIALFDDFPGPYPPNAFCNKLYPIACPANCDNPLDVSPLNPNICFNIFSAGNKNANAAIP